MSVISTRYHGDIDDRSDPRRVLHIHFVIPQSIWVVSIIWPEQRPAFASQNEALRIVSPCRMLKCTVTAGPGRISIPLSNIFLTRDLWASSKSPSEIQSQIIKLSNIHHKSIEKDSEQIRNQCKFIVNPSNIHENSNHLWTYTYLRKNMSIHVKAC